MGKNGSVFDVFKKVRVSDPNVQLVTNTFIGYEDAIRSLVNALVHKEKEQLPTELANFFNANVVKESGLSVLHWLGQLREVSHWPIQAKSKILYNESKSMLSSVYMIAQHFELNTTTGSTSWSTVGTALTIFTILMESVSRDVDAFNGALDAFNHYIGSNVQAMLLFDSAIVNGKFRPKHLVEEAMEKLRHAYRYQLAFRQPMDLYLGLKGVNDRSVDYFKNEEIKLFESLEALNLKIDDDGNDTRITDRIKAAAEFLLVAALAKDFIGKVGDTNLTLEDAFDSMPGSRKEEQMLTHTDVATSGYQVLYTVDGGESEEWSLQAQTNRKHQMKLRRDRARSAAARASVRERPPFDDAKPTLDENHQVTFLNNMETLEMMNRSWHTANSYNNRWKRWYLFQTMFFCKRGGQTQSLEL